MALLLPLLLLLFSFLTPQLALPTVPSSTLSISPFNRSSFPADFLFGAASSAYQYEGAAFEGGKGPSIWDTFTHKYPDKIADKSNGDTAENFYHLYKDDVKLMKYIGLNTFRISISWPRLLPNGKLSGGVNQEGINFYNNLINELLSNGIQPFVTIFHWDLPQALEDEYNGFLSPRIVDDFVDYANICFKEFGDRVKYWITLNEAYIVSSFGYDEGWFAPGRCSPWRNNNCPAGNSATEPYTVAHHLLLSHAATVKLYNSKYRGVQKGEIGMSLLSQWFEPYTKSKLDFKAARRSLDFFYGWFLHPIVYGDYPKSMRSIVGKRLPKFTKNQSIILKGSYDFVGVNYYSARYVTNIINVSYNAINASYSTDSFSNCTVERNGKPIGEETASPGFNIYAKGLRDLLVYTKAKYNNPTIYITENGMSDPNNAIVKEGIKDYKRIRFHSDHLRAIHEAMKHGVNVKGYLVWSFLDTFEWSSGYSVRFGICYVDYKNACKRHLKASALWFKESLRSSM